MMQIIFISVLMVFATVAAFTIALTTVGALQVTRKRVYGVLQYFFFGLFFTNTIQMLASGRSFLNDGATEASMGGGGPLVSWTVRLVSVLIMLACVDQVIRFVGRSEKINLGRALTLLFFVLFWITNLLVPTFLSAYPVNYELNWTYTLVLGVALLCLSGEGAIKAIESCRNAILIYCLLNILAVPILPGLTLDSTYGQGYIPGVPRLAGLAPHAISLGTTASIGLWCLLAWPMKSERLNKAAWIVLLVILFFTQSKTVWVSFLLGTPIMYYYREKKAVVERKSLGAVKAIYILAVAAAFLLLAVMSVYFLFGPGEDQVGRFLDGKEGAQLLSLTGRDRIWEIALQEWHKYPIFGYGLNLFDESYRISIRMMNAVNGHNEYIDSLARVGLVGTTSVVAYLALLLYYGMKFAPLTRGLSAVLILSTLVRSVSEVPLTLTSIGNSDVPYYLLLVTLAYGFSQDIKAMGRAGANNSQHLVAA